MPPRQLRTLCFLLSTMIVSFQSCQNKDRPPQLEIKGHKSWFPRRSCDTTYFLETFHRDFKGAVEWPPDNLCNTCDISVDVTGSSYMHSVEYQGQSIPLAEYNLWKLRQYLSEHDVFNYGEKVTLRLFGESKGGTETSGRENRSFQLPKLLLDVEGIKLSRRYNDLQVNVHNIRQPTLSKASSMDSAFAWFLPYVRSGIAPSNQYFRSPLIEHIKATISFYPNLDNVFRSFVFVTDGWVELDEIYFWPTRYPKNPGMLEEIKRRTISSDLKPFSDTNPNVSVIMIGLNDGGNAEYRKAQIELFKWLFSPQPVELIPY
jgi:hypothetical protein